MKGYLHKAKINVKSLAAEARIIRLEELRTSGESEIRRQMYLHRVGHVRGEARAAQLAYGFLRGRQRQQLEQSRKPLPAKRVREKAAVWLVGELPAKERDALLAEISAWLENGKISRSKDSDNVCV